MCDPEFVAVLFVKLYIVYNKWRRETFFHSILNGENAKPFLKNSARKPE